MACLHLASHVRVNRGKKPCQVSVLYLLNDSPSIADSVIAVVLGSVTFVGVAGTMVFKWFAKRRLLQRKVTRIAPGPALEQVKVSK